MNNINLPLGQGTELYAFDGEQGSRLRFDIDQEMSFLDTGLWRIFYPGGGDGIGTRTFRDDIEVVLPGDGRYVLAFQGNDAEAIAFNLQVLTPETQSQAIAVGQAIDGSLSEAGEIDRYTFVGGKGQKLWVEALGGLLVQHRCSAY